MYKIPGPELEALVQFSLRDFANHILHTPWYGKEREAVSYYAFGFLIKQCAWNAALNDPAQVAIESRVPGGPLNKKKEVCKDLVIWERPGENCWDGPGRSTRYPLVVMEWKANSASFVAYDMAYLLSLNEERPEVLCLAVTFDIARKNLGFRAARISAGQVDEGWLVVP